MKFSEVPDGGLFQHNGEVFAKINFSDFEYYGINAVILNGDEAGSLLALGDNDDVEPVRWNITKEASDER